MEYIRQMGSLALGFRLRRLGEMIGQQINNIYKDTESGFEARWFPFFQLLADNPGLSVTQIASQLEVTLPAVNQIINELRLYDLVETASDKKDKRKLLISLSPKALQINNMMANVWRDVAQVADDLVRRSGGSIFDALTALEEELARKPLEERFHNLRRSGLEQHVEIVEYKPEFKTYFCKLNEEWIDRYFGLEQADRAALLDPEKYILKSGGSIMFAIVDGTVSGTCALLKRSKSTYELSKMRVLEQFQGKGIGQKLVNACLEKARQKGGTEVILETNSVLKSAVRLYEKCGFEHIPKPKQKSFDYARGDVAMHVHL